MDESFITDLEQRYEQGQHLHTVACSSSHADALQGLAMVRLGGHGAGRATAAGTGSMQHRPHCTSISAASRGAAAVVGSGICLRLHVVTRGLEQLSRVRGDNGADSINNCLERLHSSVEKMRRRQQHAGGTKLQKSGGSDSENDDYGNSQVKRVEGAH